jgi:hypothetical protein
MTVDAAKIGQLEQELAETRRLLMEEVRRFEVIMREISEEEKERILEGLTDRQERILFGLEAPPARQGGGAGVSGGNLTCPHCGEEGLTELGLKLHITRMHMIEQKKEQLEARKVRGEEL